MDKLFTLSAEARDEELKSIWRMVGCMVPGLLYNECPQLHHLRNRLLSVVDGSVVPVLRDDGTS